MRAGLSRSRRSPASTGLLRKRSRRRAKALARARELAGPAGEIVVAGSIFLLGEVVEELEGVKRLWPKARAHMAAQTPA